MKPKINRKEQILQFATEAFSRDGYDRVTVKQLADKCGITEPAVYRHFESKDAIYVAVLESLPKDCAIRSCLTDWQMKTISK